MLKTKNLMPLTMSTNFGTMSNIFVILSNRISPCVPWLKFRTKGTRTTINDVMMK